MVEIPVTSFAKVVVPCYIVLPVSVSVVSFLRGLL